MKIVFSDLSELTIQQITSEAEGYLTIKTISAAPEDLRAIFSDEVKTRSMTAKGDDGETIATYDGYTEFYRTEEYTGKIYGVTNYKPDRTPEAQEEIIAASLQVAKIQAQTLDDEDAMTVQSLYPEWSPDSVTYPKNHKVNRNGTLYKCLQAHTSQASWAPEDAPSLWAKVLNPDPEVIPDWEQPGSTNGYAKGDKTKHNGKTWESLVDNNVWEPGVVGTEALWKEVSQ